MLKDQHTTAAGYVLAIDYGTTCSVGVVSSPAGVEVLELQRSRYLPSLVLLDDAGTLVVGRAAINQAGLYPERVCQTPKREIARPAILLGDRPVAVSDAIAAVLARIAEEAARRFDGRPPDRVVLTHPAIWSDERLGVLRAAARSAGLAEPELIAEPVAAAAHYATRALDAGAHVAVYDLGGGTFDVAVLRRTADGSFEVAGRPGGDSELGGEDFDDELRRLVEAHAAELDADAFEAADANRNGAMRDWIAFRREIRDAKEALSDDSRCSVMVPGVADPVTITRRELETLLEPHIHRTVELLAGAITDAGLAPRDLAAIYLTGGSSRIPMISTVIAEQLGMQPVTRDDPKAVVALGAIDIAAAAASPTAGTAQPVAAPPFAPRASGRPDWRHTMRNVDGVRARLAEQRYEHPIDDVWAAALALVQRLGMQLSHADSASGTIEALTGNSGMTLDLRRSSWGERLYLWLDASGDDATRVQIESRFRMRAQMSGADMHERNFELVLGGLWDALTGARPLAAAQ